MPRRSTASSSPSRVQSATKTACSGSVTSKDIHAALKAKGIDIDRKKMQLPEPIEALGTFEVPVKLLGDISATGVEVVAQKK